MKPANIKARALLAKLERLADPANRGTPGEIAAAKLKVAWLKARFDFGAPQADNTKDIFAGFKFTRRSSRAAHVYKFKTSDFDVANSVKWAIETATGVPCLFRGGDLLAETTPAAARQLSKIACHIAESFRTLLDRLGKLNGVTDKDRTVFVRGLYDGMMNAPRKDGDKLPNRIATAKKGRQKKSAVSAAPGLSVHPYTVALGLGQQIRFAAPIEQIAAELDRATQPVIPRST